MFLFRVLFVPAPGCYTAINVCVAINEKLTLFFADIHLGAVSVVVGRRKLIHGMESKPRFQLCNKARITMQASAPRQLENSNNYHQSATRQQNFLPQEFGIHHLSVSVNLSHFLRLDVIYRHFIFSQPTPLQLSTLTRISSSVRPDSSKTSVLCKSFTYLLTY